MDLDHVRRDKKDSIASMVWKTYSLKTLWVEITKGDVVCANCHRVRTYKRKTSKGAL